MAATPADIELTRRYQTRLGDLARATAQALAELWRLLESYGEEVWREAAAPTVAAAQERSGALAAAYVALLADIDTPEVTAAEGPDLADPLIAFGSALKRGLDFDTAVALGESRAEAVGEGIVKWTARAAAGEAAEHADGVVGWRRVLTGISCDWCATVSTQRYRTARSASFGHTRCDCDVVPILGDRDPGQVINEPVYDRLRQTPKSERTGYVTAAGAPAPRPAAIPQETPRADSRDG